MHKEPTSLLKYGDLINEQEKLGFIGRDDDKEIKANIKLHYIPNQPVTTQIRIVYDCSFKQIPNRASLNDCLLAMYRQN